jgi:transcriptional regulator with XRE-family HTH domain
MSMKVFSKRLKDRLAQVDFTQSELAKETGLSRSLISDYVNGKKCPSVENFHKICRVLRLSMNYLWGYKPNPLPEDVAD